MAIATPLFSSSTSIDIDMDGLSGGTAVSAQIDNRTTKYFDALVTLGLDMNSVSTSGQILVFAYGSLDGSTYSGGLTGAKATITWGTTQNTSVNGWGNCQVIGNAHYALGEAPARLEMGPFRVAPFFGGHLPPIWGIGIKIRSNLTLDNNSPSTMAADFVGVTYDV